MVSLAGGRGERGGALQIINSKPRDQVSRGRGWRCVFFSNVKTNLDNNSDFNIIMSSRYIFIASFDKERLLI